MKAAVFKQYGTPDVVTVEERSTPEPRTNEVLIKVYASTVTSGDCRIRGLNVPLGFGLLVRMFFGFTKPRNQILSMELAGEIVAKGDTVSKFKIGDRVCVDMGTHSGAHAEYVVLPETAAIAIQPGNLDPEQLLHSLGSFGGATALYF